MNELKKQRTGYLPSVETPKFDDYLSAIGLPTDNILADTDERGIVIENIPQIIKDIPSDRKEKAIYLSKFAAASAIGLFDASLNYLWDEVINNLRIKVCAYGIEYFYDNAIGANNRAFYTDENDLVLVKDKVLLDTCKKIELISEVLYKKLSHILDMRNNIGASHPNDEAINAFELLGWLKTCVNNVLSEEISEPAVAVKGIIDKIKHSETEFNMEHCTHFENAIKDLNSRMLSNFLNSLFGMFVDSKTTEIMRKNILKLFKIVWIYAKEEDKYKLGEKIDVYRANIDNDKVILAEMLFKKCNGQKYYSTMNKEIKISQLCEDLNDAHIGWDNYMHEYPISKEIASLFDKCSDIPESKQMTLIKTFLICRIGNNRNYCEGVSTRSLKYYDKLFSTMNESEVIKTVSILVNDSMYSYWFAPYQKYHIKRICELLKTNMISEKMMEILDLIIKEEGKLSTLFVSKEFKQVCKGKISFE